MRKISKIVAATALLAAFGATNVMAAEPNDVVKDAQQQKNLVKEFVSEFNKHSDELTVSVEQPYKEIKLSNGYILFAELTPGHNTTAGTTKASGDFSTLAQASNEITSTQGYKNIYGQVVIQLKTTTKWTYDFSKVVEGTTTTIAEPKMIPWVVKSKSVDPPFKGPDNRYWEWTASGIFTYNAVGMEFDTIELITHHRGNYDGTYAWKYEVVD